jgi:hypothetical protein
MEEWEMTNQHFREVVETVLCTTGTDKKRLSEEIGVKRSLLNVWMLKGVPMAKVPMIMAKLRRYTRRFV